MSSFHVGLRANDLKSAFLSLEVSPRLAVNQKHSGLFVQITFIVFPFTDALANDELVVAGEVAGDTNARGRVEVLA
jgi:hypothetical protein